MANFTDLSGETADYICQVGVQVDFTDNIFQPTAAVGVQYWDAAIYWDSATYWDGSVDGDFNTNFTDLTGV